MSIQILMPSRLSYTRRGQFDQPRGQMKSGTPVTAEVLDQIIRSDDFAAAFRTPLKDLKAKEAATTDDLTLWAGR